MPDVREIRARHRRTIAHRSNYFDLAIVAACSGICGYTLAPSTPVYQAVEALHYSFPDECTKAPEQSSIPTTHAPLVSVPRTSPNAEEILSWPDYTGKALKEYRAKGYSRGRPSGNTSLTLSR